MLIPVLENNKVKEVSSFKNFLIPHQKILEYRQLKHDRQGRNFYFFQQQREKHFDFCFRFSKEVFI